MSERYPITQDDTIQKPFSITAIAPTTSRKAKIMPGSSKRFTPFPADRLVRAAPHAADRILRLSAFCLYLQFAYSAIT